MAEAADHAGVVVLEALDGSPWPLPQPWTRCAMDSLSLSLSLSGVDVAPKFSLSLSGWAMSRHEVPLLQRPPGPWVVVLGSLAEGQA